MYRYLHTKLRNNYIRSRIMAKTLYDSGWPVLNTKVFAVGNRVEGFVPHYVRSFIKPYRLFKLNYSVSVTHHYRRHLPPGKRFHDYKMTFKPEKLKRDRSAWLYMKSLDGRLKKFLENVPKKCNVSRDDFEKENPIGPTP